MKQIADDALWITPREAAKRLSLHVGTLANWRTEDMREGRGWPEPGRNGLRWRHFGRVVRYLASSLEDSMEMRDSSITVRGEREQGS